MPMGRRGSRAARFDPCPLTRTKVKKAVLVVFHDHLVQRDWLSSKVSAYAPRPWRSGGEGQQPATGPQVGETVLRPSGRRYDDIGRLEGPERILEPPAPSGAGYRSSPALSLVFKDRPSTDVMPRVHSGSIGLRETSRPSVRSCHPPNAFRPCRSSRLRRFSPHRHLAGLLHPATGHGVRHVSSPGPLHPQVGFAVESHPQ
jgi:hypothetical protein